MPQRSNRFTLVRTAGLIATAAMVAFASACSNDNVKATEPDVTAQNGLISDLLGGVAGLLTPARALERDVALSAPITRTFTVTRKNGGKIEIEETGLRVDVPSGAIVNDTLTITVTALSGKSIAYDFQPHGTVFRKPLAFRQDLEGTSWDKSGFKGTINGGYFKDTRQINLLSGLAILDELFPVEIKTHEARFNINHFSGYMVSGGRKGSDYYEEQHADF
ncbi:MAG: hypothetical protein ACO1Q7_17955 [Gemmatimonas sp.]